MSNLFNLRSKEIEIMDDLNCSGPVIEQTLRELEIINRTLGGNGVTISGIRLLLKNKVPQAPITIADLGAGGGDILKKVADWGIKNNFNFSLTGIDANPNIVTLARKNISAYNNINFESIDIFSDSFASLKFDIYIATLFTHHFSDEQLATLFASLKKQSTIGIVVNDIHRHWLAFHAIRLLTLFFSKSPMVQNDAPLSVLRAFKRHELMSIMQRAGIENYSLRWRWAFRWELVIPSSGKVA